MDFPIEALLAWYRQNRRMLPWRVDPTPYHVWLSEVMLQQTRVEAVIGYYGRFIEALPEVADLALADEEHLLKLWEGLGYYSRVRNLQRAAQMIMREYGGVLPGDYEELKRLPGVGDYTAGAIGSIVFGLPTPAVDGNVLRVWTRHAADPMDIALPAAKKTVFEALRTVYPTRNPDAGDLTQALMALGQQICTPSAHPDCGRCPMRESCAAYRMGKQADYPVKSAKRPKRIEQRTVFLVQSEGKIALKKRPEKGLLAGLWELPGTDGWLDSDGARRWISDIGAHAKSVDPAPDAKHVFTHVEWHMRAWSIALDSCADIPENMEFVWATPDELESRYALPSAFSKWKNDLKKSSEKTGFSPDKTKE